MIKLVLILIVAGVIYVSLNWDTLSPKMSMGLDDAKEMMEKGNALNDKMHSEIDETKEKIDSVKESLDELIEKK